MKNAFRTPNIDRFKWPQFGLSQFFAISHGRFLLFFLVPFLLFESSVFAQALSNTPYVFGPIDLNSTTASAIATVTGTAVGSGVNGPTTAQVGMSVNISKDNWWSGGAVGEVDGIYVTVRQNSATSPSDSSGLLIDVQNQGNGFLSATEFNSTIVNPTTNSLIYGVDVQEGVLNKPNGDYLGAVYTATYGALKTGILI